MTRRPAGLARLSFALLAALAFGPASAQQAGLQPIPAYSARVIDTIGMLQPDEKARVEGKLKALEDRKGSQLAVLLVDSTQPEEIEQYSIRVADAWKVGRKKVDDGAILIVARGDRRMRIEVGRGLEGALTDLVSNRIIDETLKPAFRAGEFGAGIEAGVDRMIGVIDGEPLPPPDPRWSERGGRESGGSPVALAVLGLALVLGIVISAAKGRFAQALSSGGSLGVMGLAFTGSLVFALLLALFGVFAGGFGSTAGTGGYYSGRRGDPWGGGGFGGGGGGGFGGGGASGSW